MNDRRKFLKGFGLAGAVAIGAVTATRVQISQVSDIPSEILADLESPNMTGCISFVRDDNMATWKVGRDGKLYLRENNQWRHV